MLMAVATQIATLQIMDRQQLSHIAIVTRRNTGLFRLSVEWLCTGKFMFRVWKGTTLIGQGYGTDPYDCERKFVKGEYEDNPPF